MVFTRRLATSVAVLSMSVVLCACGGADARRATHMHRGEQYFATSNFEKARVEFRNALQISPNDAEARYMNGRVAEKLGDLRGAVGMYQGTIDVDHGHFKARASLGRLFVFGGAPQRALEIIEPGLVAHADDADLLTVRGAARYQLKDKTGALEDAERATALAPQNEGAVALLASLYRQGGQAPRAIELVRTFLEQHSDSVELRQVLANLYLFVNDPGLALQELRKVVETEPQELSHRVRLALQYLRARKAEEAEKVMREATEALPESDEAKLAYVDFLVAQGSAVRGEQVLRQYIQRDPKDFDLQLGLASLQQREGSVEEAIATYERIIAADADGPAALSARNRIAAIHYSRGQFDEARRLVDLTLANNPRDNDALVLRGNLALARQDSAGAISDLRAVLRDQPASPGVLRTLARAHVANGEPALAEEALRQAMEVAAADVAVRVELAQLLSRTSRGEQAVALLEETVRSAPSDVPAREALARAYISARNFEAAKIAAEDLETLAPTLAIGPYLAGVVAQARQRPDEALERFSRALELQPTAMDALAAVTRLDWEAKRRERALARVHKAIAAEPKNAVAKNLLGELLLSDKRYTEAAPVFAGATALAPRWWMPWRNLAIAQLGVRDIEAALETYANGIAATKQEPALVTELAALYERQGRVDEAIQQYQSLHEKNPALDAAANNLAMLLVTYRGDRASLDKARELTQSFASSDNGALLDTHGWVMFKLGQYEEALPLLERAAQRAPELRIVRYHLAMAQLKAGRQDEARNNLERALAGSASFNGVDEARTVLASLGNQAG